MSELCRERHVKCVTKDETNRCERCKERNETCNRKSTVRFRAVTSISKRTKRGRTERQNIVYKDDQTWTKLTGPVNFLDKHDENDNVSPDPLQEKTNPPPANDVGTEPFDMINVDNPSDMTQPHGSDIEILQLPGPQEGVETAYHHAETVIDPAFDLEEIASNGNIPQSRSMLSGISPSFHFIIPSPNHSTPNSWPELGILPPLYRMESGAPLKTRKEARLLCHFIEVLTPEMDICDPLKHFAREAPQRAMYCPALMNAILALTSRHTSLIRGVEEESDRYLANCLSSLIPALDDPGDVLDENLFLTVVILRLYEERSKDIDEQCHRMGQTRLLNTTSAFAAGGGMAEAASWLSLRQEVRCSFCAEQRSNVRLENYLQSKAFLEDDEGSWTNRIVYITAKVLACVFQDEREVTCAEWDEFEEAIEAWDRDKPAAFNPIWTTASIAQASQPAANVTNATSKNPPAPLPDEPVSAFPEIIMAQGAHAVAAQYYNTAKMLLATHNPHLPHVGFDALRRRRDADRLAVTYLRRIVGLAVSNPACENAMFMASHALHTCGFWLSGRREQEEAVRFLGTMQRKMGWLTRHIVENLRRHWGELGAGEG